MGILDGIGDAASQVGGFFKGAGETLWETGKGVVELGAGAVTTAYDLSPAGALLEGATHLYENATGNDVELPGWLPSAERGGARLQAAADTVATIAGDPGLLVDAVVAPIVDDWNNGNYGEAVGRGATELLLAVVGTKGIDKAAKGARVANAVDTAGDVARTTRIADRVEDVASAGRAARTVDAVTRYRTALTAGDDAAATAAARELAELSTRGSGTADRVVLGKWEQNGGYIAEAQRNGGVWYETGPGVYDELTRGLSSDEARRAAWQVNEQFLDSQLERGVGRIELTGESIQEVLTSRPDSFTAMEIDYLSRNAAKYGYVREGNAWVKQN